MLLLLRYICITHFTACCTATTAAVEGKMSKSLKKLLKKLVVGEAQEQLAVADAKLGNVIKVVLQRYKFALKFCYSSITNWSTDVCLTSKNLFLKNAYSRNLNLVQECSVSFPVCKSIKRSQDTNLLN